MKLTRSQEETLIQFAINILIDRFTNPHTTLTPLYEEEQSPIVETLADKFPRAKVTRRKSKITKKQRSEINKKNTSGKRNKGWTPERLAKFQKTMALKGKKGYERYLPDSFTPNDLITQ